MFVGVAYVVPWLDSSVVGLLAGWLHTQGFVGFANLPSLLPVLCLFLWMLHRCSKVFYRCRRQLHGHS